MCQHCVFYLMYDRGIHGEVNKRYIQLMVVQNWDLKEFLKSDVNDENNLLRFNNSSIIVSSYCIGSDKKSPFSEYDELKKHIKNLEKMGFEVIKGECEHEF